MTDHFIICFYGEYQLYLAFVFSYCFYLLQSVMGYGQSVVSMNPTGKTGFDFLCSL